MPHLIGRNVNDGINAPPHCPECEWWNKCRTSLPGRWIMECFHCPECEWWNIFIARNVNDGINAAPHCPKSEWWNKCRTSFPGMWMIWVAERWCAGPPRCRVLLSCASSVSLSSHCIAAPFALPAGSGSTTSINQSIFVFFRITYFC